MSASGTSIAGVKALVVAQAKAYFWTPGQAFVLADGLERAQELKAPAGSSLAGLKAILVSPALFGDSDRLVLWNADHVYRKLSGGLTLQELVSPSGAPLAGDPLLRSHPDIRKKILRAGRSAGRCAGRSSRMLTMH